MGLVHRLRRSSSTERRSRKSDKRRSSIRGRKSDCSSSSSSSSSSGRREGEKEKKRKRRRSDVRRRNDMINEEASGTDTKLHVRNYEKFEELRYRNEQKILKFTRNNNKVASVKSKKYQQQKQ